jgi:hypothetical protein
MNFNEASTHIKVLLSEVPTSRAFNVALDAFLNKRDTTLICCQKRKIYVVCNGDPSTYVIANKGSKKERVYGHAMVFKTHVGRGRDGPYFLSFVLKLGDEFRFLTLTDRTNTNTAILALEPNVKFAIDPESSVALVLETLHVNLRIWKYPFICHIPQFRDPLIAAMTGIPEAEVVSRSSSSSSSSSSSLPPIMALANVAKESSVASEQSSDLDAMTEDEDDDDEEHVPPRATESIGQQSLSKHDDDDTTDEEEEEEPTFDSMPEDMCEYMVQLKKEQDKLNKDHETYKRVCYFKRRLESIPKDLFRYCYEGTTSEVEKLIREVSRDKGVLECRSWGYLHKKRHLDLVAALEIAKDKKTPVEQARKKLLKMCTDFLQ